MKKLIFKMAVITLSSLLSLLGCGGAESLAYTNPEWRDSVARSVTFPLGERIELRVRIFFVGKRR